MHKIWGKYTKNTPKLCGICSYVQGRAGKFDLDISTLFQCNVSYCICSYDIMYLPYCIAGNVVVPGLICWRATAALSSFTLQASGQHLYSASCNRIPGGTGQRAAVTASCSAWLSKSSSNLFQSGNSDKKWASGHDGEEGNGLDEDSPQLGIADQ